MMNKTKKLIMMAGLLLATSCSGIQPVSTGMSNTETPQPTITTNPVPTETESETASLPPQNPTPSYIYETQTAIPSATSTPDHASGIRTQCIIPQTSLPDDLSGPLNLVIGDNFYNIKTEVLQPILPLLTTEQFISGHEISPDRKNILLEYCEDTSSGRECTNAIIDLNGIVTTSSRPKNASFEIWLNNEKLIILHYTSAPSNTIQILNPFTKESVDFSLDIPKPYYAMTIDNVYILPVEIDPTLTRVIFSDNEGIGRIIMWDITSGQQLAWLPFEVPQSPGDPPEYFYSFGWSPDASQYITTSPVTFVDPDKKIPAAEELFSISRDGTIHQLTHVSQAYKYVNYMGFAWSPDGRYVAFWLHTDDVYLPKVDWKSPRLAILDTETNEIVDYCLTSRYISQIPIWSPDGRYLAVRISTEGLQVQLLLIDPIKGYSYSIAENIQENNGIEGWMTEP